MNQVQVLVIMSRDPRNHVFILKRKTCEPRHDKTCLWEFPTRPDTNWPAQPQELARVLKFRL